MTRRDFFHGVLIGTSAAAGTALIQLATPAELKAFAKDEAVLVSKPPMLVTMGWNAVGEPVYMRTRDGAYAQVGVVRNLTIQSNVMDITTWDSDVQVFAPAMKQYLMSFVGPR